MRIGDKVYLNSGSPMLTVTWVEKAQPCDLVYVHWYSGDGLEEASFPEVCLTTEKPVAQETERGR